VTIVEGDGVAVGVGEGVAAGLWVAVEVGVPAGVPLVEGKGEEALMEGVGVLEQPACTTKTSIRAMTPINIPGLDIFILLPINL
jgi:hypothetical protein